MRYSIIMPYYNRAVALHNTFVSFRHHYEGRNDWQVILIEDAKNLRDEGLRKELMRTIGEFPTLPITLVHCAWFGHNPAPLFNYGASMAMGEYLILTSPECFHETPILNQLDAIFQEHPQNYVICACRSLAPPTKAVMAYPNLPRNHDQWYQHTEHRNACYHFCSAIRQVDYEAIGGFDERYGEGFGFDDDDFRNRVRVSGLPFIIRDDLLVLHQHHIRTHQILPRREYMDLFHHNKKLYEDTWDGQAT